MRIAINDASILIDLSTIDVLTPFFELPFDMMTTDFIIEEIPSNFINIVGIESPGLTSAPAIAKHISSLISAKIKLHKKKKFVLPSLKNIRFEKMTLKQKANIINKNKDHSQIICRCEKVTKGELLNALNNTLGVKTLSGLKYRTRLTMGRCHGGYCVPKIIEILKKEANISPCKATLKGKGSELIKNYVK